MNQMSCRKKLFTAPMNIQLNPIYAIELHKLPQGPKESAIHRG
jgi:hypothetical protein